MSVFTFREEYYFPTTVPVTFNGARSDQDIKPNMDNIKKEVEDLGYGGNVATVTDDGHHKKNKTEKETKKSKNKKRKIEGDIDDSPKDAAYVIEQFIAINRILKGLQLDDERKNEILAEVIVTLKILDVEKKNKKVTEPYECPKCRHHGKKSGAQHRSEESRGYQAVCPYRNCKCLPCIQVNANNLNQARRRKDKKAKEWRDKNKEDRRRQQQRRQQ